MDPDESCEEGAVDLGDEEDDEEDDGLSFVGSSVVGKSRPADAAASSRKSSSGGSRLPAGPALKSSPAQKPAPQKPPARLAASPVDDGLGKKRRMSIGAKMAGKSGAEILNPLGLDRIRAEFNTVAEHL